jgi:glycosyltransferase involved in cell wall biosynthesis
VNTGFGIVAKNLLTRWHKSGHEIAALGVNHYGEPYNHEELPFDIWPCDKGGVTEIFGHAKLWYLVEKNNPDLLFFINDPWVISDYLRHKPAHINPKMVAYFPIDAGPLKPEWGKMLTDNFEAQVCYSHFAEHIVTEANGGKRPKNLHQIYHGVDTSVFYPVNVYKARQLLGIPEESFVIGMVARNQFRKRFDLLINAFSKFAKDKPEAKLYLHTALRDIGFDINDLARQYNITDKLILTDDVHAAQGVPETTLNLIYNTFDINALISTGDGFGLPVAESMATGCPQVVSDHSCLRELTQGTGGLGVKTAAWIANTSGINTWGAISDIDDIVDKFELLYRNPDLRQKLGKEGYEFITQPQFNWDNIAVKFENIFKKIFHIYIKEEAMEHGITTQYEPVSLSR